MAAKLRQVQSAGGFASVLVKGHDQAGAINLILRLRDGTLKRAVPGIASDEGKVDRHFEWRDDLANDTALTAHVERERKFDCDQWFIECECSKDQFESIFDVKPL